MNLFYTSECPIKCAQYLDDKRVVKMVLETAQMLATAIQVNGGEATYRITHKNHPSTKWVTENKSNFRWALRHFAALSREYTRRYGKVHKCNNYLKEFMDGIKHLPDGDLTPVPNCAANKEHGVSFKHIEDTTLAYQMYLNVRWDNDKRKPEWT